MKKKITDSERLEQLAADMIATGEFIQNLIDTWQTIGSRNTRNILLAKRRFSLVKTHLGVPKD